MLFRIINVNTDGSVKLISEDITNNLRYTEEKYKDSNIDKWLNSVFLPSITSSNYLVQSDYCVGSIASTQDTTNSCSEKITSKVGLLSVDEYNKTLANGISSINHNNNTYSVLANKTNNETLVVNEYKQVVTINNILLPPIKPVITVKANIYITSGDGSKTNPYKLEDYTYGKEHDKINTRIVGEYFNYSGVTFRIIGKDSKNNVKAIMTEPLMNNTTNVPLMVSLYGINNYKYNNTDTNNPGYIINNNYIDYINEKSLLSGDYKIITNEMNVSYDKFKSTKTTTKLMLASTLDLFSGLNISFENNSRKIQLFSDVSPTENSIFMLNVIDGMGFEVPKSSYDNYAFRLVTILNGNLTLASGRGTHNSPYILK